MDLSNFCIFLHFQQGKSPCNEVTNAELVGVIKFDMIACNLLSTPHRGCTTVEMASLLSGMVPCPHKPYWHGDHFASFPRVPLFSLQNTM